VSVSIHDSNRYGALTEERLAQLEERLGQRLPEDYRAHMLAHNGGRPAEEGFAFFNEGLGAPDRSILSAFFAIHDGAYDDSTPEGCLGQPLEDVWECCAEELEEPATLPIGRDPCGNLICLRYSGEKAGRIFFYDHETETPSPLADSFSAFLASLTPAPDD